MTTRQISTPFWKLDPSIIVLFFLTFDLRAVFFSRIAMPTASKRRREGSMDLETGMESKKSRNGAPEPASNLAKSKSKSMMNIAGRPASGVPASR